MKKKEMSEKIQATMKGNTNSKPSTPTQKELPAPNAKSSTSVPKKKAKEELEERRKKKEISEDIKATMKGNTNSKPSTPTQKELPASKARSKPAPKKNTKEGLKPESKKTGMFQKITSAIMGRK